MLHICCCWCTRGRFLYVVIAFEFTTVLLFTYPPPPHTQYRDVGITMGFPGGSGGKASTCNAEDPGSIPRSGRSPREGNGNPLQHSCLENSMDRRAWRAVVCGAAKSQTQWGRTHHAGLITVLCEAGEFWGVYEWKARGCRYWETSKII